MTSRSAGLGAVIIALFGASVVFASDDPIKDRKEVMKGNGDAAKTVVAMLKGEKPYDGAAVEKAMMDKFSSTVVEAGTAKWLKQFRMPMPRAASPTKKIYGMMMRFRAMASSQPVVENGAITWREKITPSTVITDRTRAMVQNSLLANSHSSSFERSRMYVVKTGTKEAATVPSPTKRLKRLGMRYAKTNESALRVVPRSKVMRWSRT